MTKKREYVRTVLEDRKVLIELYKECEKKIYRGESDDYKPYIIEDEDGWACLAKFDIPAAEKSRLNKILTKGIKS